MSAGAAGPPTSDPILYIITVIVGAVTSFFLAFYQRAKSAVTGVPRFDAEAEIREIKDDVKDLKETLDKAVDLLGNIREVYGRNDERVKALQQRLELAERDIDKIEYRLNSFRAGPPPQKPGREFRRSPV